MARTLIEMIVQTDVRDLLPSIRVPTLVLHREEEFIPVECARYLAEHIPGARLVVLPGWTTSPVYGDAEGYAEEIEEFLTGARQAPVVRPGARDRDVHRHRRLHGARGGARRRGAGGSSLGRHDELVRAQLERYRGREIKTMGDGFLATFDGPARAIRCARAIADAVRALEHRAARRAAHRRVRDRRRRHRRHGRQHRRPGRRARRRRERCSSPAPSRTSSSARASPSRTAAPTAQGRARRVAPVRRGQNRHAGQQPARRRPARGAAVLHGLLKRDPVGLRKPLPRRSAGSMAAH